MRLPDPQASGWLDGVRVQLAEVGISVSDPAFHVGLGVFETIALRAGRLLEPSAHLDRLAAGAQRLGIALPARERIEAVAAEAARAEPASCAWLKVLATRGGRWLVVSGAMDPADEGRVVSAVVLPWRRNPADPLSGVKTMSYAQNELGLEEARRRGADEGLWLNTRGHLAEGCTSNVFVVVAGRLFTPDLRQGLLAGVVRGIALDAARAMGVDTHETRVRPKRLARAREAFLTSSLCGVRPLVRIDGRAVGDGEPGPLTLRIACEVRRLRGCGSDD